MTAVRLGEIAGPMLDRLLAKRRRLGWVHEATENGFVLVPTIVIAEEPYRYVFALCWGPFLLGVAWRRV